MDLFLIYLILINAVGFLLMLSDKYKARKKQWRIPERVLLTVAFLGGSLGSILGMQLFRHKTRHLKFSLGLPAIFALQAILIIFMYSKI